MLVDCPTPTEVKCWQCGGWGHIGKNCPKRDTDPNLMNPVYLRELAGQHGWQWRRTKKSVKGVQKDIKTMFLKNDRGTKIDLYYGTMTIKTIVPDHPKGGKPLYRPGGYHAGEEKLVQILADPRVHTGIGYRKEAGATWTCRKCDSRKPRAEFGTSQWSKRARRQAKAIDDPDEHPGILCRDCN